MSISEINNVIDGGYCIGCGGCAYKNPNIEILRNELGLLVATKSNREITHPSEQVTLAPSLERLKPHV